MFAAMPFVSSDNMMYPREDRQNRRLDFVCQTCREHQPADQTTVYTNNITVVAKYDFCLSMLFFFIQNNSPLCLTLFSTHVIAVNPHIIVDPTLPRSYEACCPKCGHNEAVFFTNPNKGEESMALTFVCCNTVPVRCSYSWDQEEKSAKK
jgi:DNA-directed RNA polymerase II subunit RPB9